MRYSFGDIVLIDFPFSNQTGIKRRPALVILQDSEADLLLARVRSKPQQSFADVPIEGWRESKLLFSSAVRLEKLATFSSDLIEAKIGELSQDDKAAVIAAFRKLLDSLEPG